MDNSNIRYNVYIAALIIVSNVTNICYDVHKWLSPTVTPNLSAVSNLQEISKMIKSKFSLFVGLLLLFYLIIGTAYNCGPTVFILTIVLCAVNLLFAFLDV